MLQHGDVILKSVIIPNNLKSVETKKIVLAEGEVTGHAHVITDIAKVDLFKNAGKTFIKVKSPVELKHEEHKTIVIQPGSYEIDQVKEYDPWADEIRNVKD